MPFPLSNLKFSADPPSTGSNKQLKWTLILPDTVLGFHPPCPANAQLPNGEVCFHLADEKTEGQKGGITCSRLHKARRESEHRVQAFRLLHAGRLTLLRAHLPLLPLSLHRQKPWQVHLATLRGYSLKSSC